MRVFRVCRVCVGRVVCRQGKQDERGNVWLAVLFVFSDCPFCEHILRKKERSLTLARTLHPVTRDPRVGG